MQKIDLSLINEVLNEIRRDTNGAVVGSMLELVGDERYINYGVSLPAIKRVAKNYACNHELALALFDTNIRELKLAAIYIDAPREVTEVQMRVWSGSFDSQDIVENCCSMLFSRCDYALHFANEWYNKMPYASLLMVSRRARDGYNSDEELQYIEFVNKIIPFGVDDKYFEIKCRTLANLYVKNDTIKNIIDREVENEKISECMNWFI